MVRLSNQREHLIEQLSQLIPAAQTETHALDEAAAARLGINRTDLRCLGVLLERGTLSAGALAESVRLTRAAMTTALDRLQKARFIRRIHDPADRRGVNVEATAAAKKALEEIWGPIRRDGLALLEKYKDTDLEVLMRFFEQYSDLQKTHAQRIRARKRQGVKS
jgi:DNA-binding MarR family transcriptional regulator